MAARERERERERKKGTWRDETERAQICSSRQSLRKVGLGKLKMELNSLGTAGEDTHGAPKKLRRKMYSLFFSLFLTLSLSLSHTHSPSIASPVATLSQSPLSFWNSSATRAATRLRRRRRRVSSPLGNSSATQSLFRVNGPATLI